MSGAPKLSQDKRSAGDLMAANDLRGSAAMIKHPMTTKNSRGSGLGTFKFPQSSSAVKLREQGKRKMQRHNTEAVGPDATQVDSLPN